MADKSPGVGAGGKKTRALHLALVAVLLALYIVACAVKAPRQYEENFHAVNAPWHVLVTAKAMQETPVSVHKFLPIVSLGQPEDKFIQWGDTVMDRHGQGNYYYTSFMPLTFVVAWLFYSLTGLPYSELTLYWFSSGLAILCYLATLRLLLRLFRDKLPPVFVILCSYFIYFYLPEMLHSNGAVYWGQSLYQLFFALQLNVYVELREKRTWPRFIAFLALAFLVCCVEWTGYLSNVGFFLAYGMDIFLAARRGGRVAEAGQKRPAGRLAPYRPEILSMAGLAVVSVGALGAFCFHFILNLTVQDFVAMMQKRMAARTGQAGHDLPILLQRYWSSFHYFLIVLAVLAAVALGLYLARRKGWPGPPLGALLFLTCLPVLENLILLNHAIDYSYDRMKTIFPMLLLFFAAASVVAACLPKGAGAALAGLSLVLLLVSGFNLFTYARRGAFGGFSYIVAENYESDPVLAEYVQAHYSGPDTVMLSSTSVRGWTNILFGRGVYEEYIVYNWDETDIFTIAAQRGAKRVVYLCPEPAWYGKDIHNKAVVFDLEAGDIYGLVYDYDSKQVEVTEDLSFADAFYEKNRTYIDTLASWTA